MTAGLDKTLALWRCSGGEELGGGGFQEVGRLVPPGGPAFSLLALDRTPDGRPVEVLIGNHGRQVVAWVPPAPALEEGLALEGHSGEGATTGRAHGAGGWQSLAQPSS